MPNGTRIAGGKLVEKLRNTWRNLKQSGITKTSVQAVSLPIDDRELIASTCEVLVVVVSSQRIYIDV